ncbi:AmmeMemoRadiSam system protein B [Pseudobacteroides cellulosolvens]|uniref:UPF0103/Mediator of ErbB2-driven cell motility-containing protein n=1 Tax=Pseudobacteroides cellulosolvens ATCC 35603 = DSM 2933 TaxID=398512 RepID=A0A0L6JQP8_9FIRM|nr:AmmeMemoRadiSam system protein B [Pseudobacteroides cellulosolvens]KNY28114.1 UPF0103/Mediator of ErbB2-driven cell motility-containing protein [Pseudobacteroides cellulosolvens ATCC 35603 = DSM 2933]
MNKLLRYMAVCLTLIIIAGGFAACSKTTGNIEAGIKPIGTKDPERGVPEIGTKDTPIIKDMIRCIYYNDAEFMQSIRIANKQESYKGDIVGGIVPHHLLACDLIASFFKTVSNGNYDCVVVIGPNHKREGNQMLNTALESWSTPFGVLEPDDNLIKRITGIKTSESKTRLLEVEHSVSSIVPYIKYYLPDAKIVPVILHGNYGMKKSIELGHKIYSSISQKKALVIASVDFSHYLTPEKADKMDEITLRALKSWDINAISQMTNDNMDSPPSIMTFLTVMKDAGTDGLRLLGHDNSARIAKTYSDSTTSYFTAVFERNK